MAFMMAEESGFVSPIFIALFYTGFGITLAFADVLFLCQFVKVLLTEKRGHLYKWLKHLLESAKVWTAIGVFRLSWVYLCGFTNFETLDYIWTENSKKLEMENKK